METSRERTVYEEKMNQTLLDMTDPIRSRVKIVEGVNEFGYHNWHITPTNPKAAPIYIEGVDDELINMTVGDLHWIELFVDEDEYTSDMPYFRPIVQALIEGRAVSWSVKGDIRPDKTRKALIEIDVGEGRPLSYAMGFFFTRRFKKRKDVAKRLYEAY